MLSDVPERQNNGIEFIFKTVIQEHFTEIKEDLNLHTERAC